MEDGGSRVMVGRSTPVERDLWSPSLIDEATSKEKPLKVRFSGPAKYWTDAVPIGNGRLGAMVWGGVATETINLNGWIRGGIFQAFCAPVEKQLRSWEDYYEWRGIPLNSPVALLLHWDDGDGGEWVMVGRPNEKDLWTPSFNVTEEPLKVRFSGPAKYWSDAAPIGNGRLGAMLWGGVATETINLNEDTLWSASPGSYTNPDAPKALTEVRKLVDDGKYPEATTAAVALSGNPSAVYQLVGDIILKFDDHLAYNEETYLRELDLDTATVNVKYSVGEVKFTRQHFASYPDQVFVTKISGSKSGSLSFTVSFDSKLNHQSYVNAQSQIIMDGNCSGDNDDTKGILFSAILDLRISDGVGGIHALDGNKLKVEGCDWAVMVLAASSSFDGPFTKPSDSKKNPTLESQSTLNSLKNTSYSELLDRHLQDYQKLFHRVSLHLSKSSKSVEESKEKAISTAERVKSFRDNEDPSLVELLFQYGRYLLISCSRPGTQPANLQGIWNNFVYPPWDGAPHLNINLQMNYWPSLPCNLGECQEPLFEYMSTLAANGSKTAKVNYEASGWVAHSVSDIWGKTSPDRGEALWALWPMGGAWLCTHLWEHYLFTLNEDFLKKKAYPLLEGCTSFLLDWLVEGRGGFLVTNPSTSPEHYFTAPDGKPACVSYSSAMDMSIIKEVFSSIVSAAEVLGKKEDDLIQKVLKAQPRLFPMKIARDGSIMEWAQDFEDPDVHHRHVSHLFGLFPGNTITVEKTPDISKAADFTLVKRGEEGPGWSTTWKAALWARLHNSDHAYRMVKHLFDLVDPDHESNYEGGLYSNLFTAHPPFQIDANFGFCSAVVEMLVQSTVMDLYLLPALPRDKWGNGCVKGLKARGNVTVNIAWNEGELHEFGVWSNNEDAIKKVHYRGRRITTTISAGKVYTFNKQLKCIKTSSFSAAETWEKRERE